MLTGARKKAIIYVFSGTGNTLTAARKTAKALYERGIRTDLYRIVAKKSDLYQTAFYEGNDSGGWTARSAGELPVAEISEEFGKVPDPNRYEIAGFAYPIHAFNSPRFFLRFVKNLPKLQNGKKGMRAFIFKTSGEPFKPNASSSYTLVHALKKKGFDPGMEIHMLMPYNIIFRYPKAMAKQMYLHTEKMAQNLADRICREDYEELSYSLFLTLFAYVLRVQWLGAAINGPLHKIKKAACIGCEICAKNCPSANIQMVNAASKKDPSAVHRIPKIGRHCTMCMNCTMGCPKAAINPGFLTPWKVNPKWDYAQLLADDAIPSNWTDNPDAGYFRFFRKYYERTAQDSEIRYDPGDDIGDETHDGGCEADPNSDSGCGFFDWNAQ